MAYPSSSESTLNPGKKCQIFRLACAGIRKPKQRRGSRSERIFLGNPNVITRLAKDLRTLQPSQKALSPTFWAVLFTALSTNTLNPQLLTKRPGLPKTPSVSAPNTSLPGALTHPTYTLLTQNAFSPTSFYPYPRPPTWPPSLPYTSDPTTRLPTDPPCYLCHLPTCKCHPFTSSSILHPPIHLHHYGPKGWGVRTLQNLPPGAILDEYVGEILPYHSTLYPSTYSVALALPRGGRGVEGGGIAQICAQRKGNWTRFVNHSCRPNCRLETMVVGRRWRVMVVAVRGVGCGEEVTVDYGGGYWRGRRRGGCVCGEGCEWGEGIL